MATLRTIGGVPPSLDYFYGLSESEAAALRERGQRRDFARGQALMYEGQVADRILIIQTGRVKITATIATGRDVVLAFCGPGELVGELAALDGDPRSASVIALERVETIALTAGAFSAFLAEHPPAALALLRRLSARLREADAKRVEFAAHGTLERVAIRLLELCERFGEERDDAIDIALPLSQEELAGWTAASLESVTRALQTMRTLGWIETRRRHIRVLDADALAGAAQIGP